MAYFNAVTGFSTTLAQSMTSSQLTMVLTTVTIQGHALVTNDYGTLYFTINPGAANQEVVKATSNSGTTFTLTLRGLAAYGQGDTELSAYKFNHSAGEPVIVSNAKNFEDQMVNLAADQTITGLKTFANANRPALASDTDSSANEQLITAGQLARAVLGTVTTSKVIVSGTAGETLVSGDAVYLKVSDGRWWKTDADDATTVNNVQKGIAQGAGTAGNAITGGVQTGGLATNLTGLTANTKYYFGNTAGAFSTTAGTVEVTAGYAISTTAMLFNPGYDQQLTEDEQDALAGTSGTPSATNKFVTQQGLIQFGGDGSDGALSITSGTTTIDCANAKYVYKNYTSISITGTGALAFSNPSTTGTVIILRSQGNVTITSSTNPAIDVRGLGAPGGAGGAVTADGVSGSNPIENIGGAAVLGVKGLTGSSAAAAGGAAATLTPFYTDSIEKLYRGYVQLSIGGGGGGGGGNNGGGGGSGGAGGRGGGGLYIECAGAYNVTSTLNASGNAGTAGGDAGGAFNGGGGGGGGAGGSIIALYKTLTADSGTYTKNGGAGGNGGTYGNAGGGVGGGGAGGAGGYAGAGGAGGGANAGSGSGTNGSVGAGGATGGAAGTGGTGSGTGSGGGGGGGGAGGFSLVAQIK